MEEKNTPSWFEYNDLPHLPFITLMTMAGEVFFKGSLEDLRMQQCSISSNNTYPVYLVGSTNVKTLQELVDVIDWTQPKSFYTIVFQPGVFKDRCHLLYYDKWYEANGWVRAIKETLPVCVEIIPNSWKLDESGIWWRPLFNSYKLLNSSKTDANWKVAKSFKIDVTGK